jgi:hypothetical protein
MHIGTPRVPDRDGKGICIASVGTILLHDSRSKSFWVNEKQFDFFVIRLIDRFT